MGLFFYLVMFASLTYALSFFNSNPMSVSKRRSFTAAPSSSSSKNVASSFWKSAFHRTSTDMKSDSDDSIEMKPLMMAASDSLDLDNDDGDGKSKDLTYQYIVLGVLFITFASNQWARQAIYYLCDFSASGDPVKHINVALDFNKEQYATLASFGFTIVFAMVSFFAGTISDNYNRSTILSLSCLAWSACTALQGQARTYNDLIPLRASLGASQAFFNPAAYTILSDIFPQKMIGTVNGIFSGGVYLGGALASLSILLDNEVGWSNTMKVIGGIGIIASVMCFSIVREPREDVKKYDNVEKDVVDTMESNTVSNDKSTVEEGTVEGTGNILLDALTAIQEVTSTYEAKLLFAGIGLRFCAGFSIGIWKAPFIFSKFPGIDTAFASSNAAIVAGGGLASTLLGGYLSDRLTNTKPGVRPRARMWVPAVGSLLAAPLWALFILSPDPKITAVALLCEYLVAECWFGPTLAALFTAVPANRKGTAQGLFSVLTALGNTAPVLIGALSGGALGNYSLDNVLLYSTCGCYVICGILFGMAAMENEKKMNLNTL